MYDQCLIFSKERLINFSKFFYKRCIFNRWCIVYNLICEGLDVIKCDFSCCMGDYCNIGLCCVKFGSFVLLVIVVWVYYMYD